MLTHDCDGDSEEEEEDVHICILYQNTDKFYGYDTVRSNRFYLIHDPKGSKLSFVEDYHKTLHLMRESNINVTRHMFAGYQYMEALPKYDAKARFFKIRDEWKSLKQEDPGHTIHAELAHFNFHHTIHYIIKHLFDYVDSVGFNEQEMFSLYNQFIFYKNRERESDEDEAEIGPSSSRLTVYDSIDLITKLIKRFIEDRFPGISRLQYHTLGHMITCYDPLVWDSADDSLMKAGLTSALYCSLHSKEKEKPLCESHTIKKIDLSNLPLNTTVIASNSTYPGAENFMQYISITDSKFI